MSRQVRLHITGKGPVDIFVPGNTDEQAVDWVLTQLEIEGINWWAVPEQRRLLMVRRYAVTGVEVLA